MKYKIITIVILNLIVVILIFNTYILLEKKQIHDTIIIKEDKLSLNLDNIINYMTIIGINEKYHSEIISQIIFETGHMCSNIRFKNNNLFGFRNNSEYIKYNHWTQSICHWKLLYYNKIKTTYYELLLNTNNYAECNMINYVNKLKQIKKNYD